MRFAGDQSSIIAQRLKRLSSIVAKLQRLPLELSEMQDIGGCRAVVSSVAQVDELVELYSQSHMRHEPVDKDDYIREPKKSGYRSYHLIYTYHSDRNRDYNGLKVEVQLRSLTQHAWATAVETVGAFLGQALKSSVGNKDWLRFFKLISTANAEDEGMPIVPGTPADRGELVKELRAHATRLDVERTLGGFSTTLQTLEEGELETAHYFLLELDPANDSVTITGFPQNHLRFAAAAYAKAEKSITTNPGAQAVLVSVESIDWLRKAYPNYFADTTLFLDGLRKAIN